MTSVLIFRRGSIGDAIVSIPALNAIAKAHPDAERWILTNMPVMESAAAIEDVLKNSMLVQGYINLPRGGGGWAQTSAAIDKVRALKPDCLYYLSEPSGFLARLKERAFFHLCGLRNVVGAPDAVDTARYRKLETGLWESETARLLRVIGAESAQDRTPDWTFAFTQTEYRTAEDVLAGWAGRERYILFSLGAKLPDKDWGDTNWTHVLDRLSADRPNLGLVAIGAQDESPRTQRMLAAWRGPTLNLCGRTAPRISALVGARARFYLGHDSGPMHLAALVGTPCVAIFSARAKPGVWFPRGSSNRIFYPWDAEPAVSARTGFRVAGNSIAAIQPEPVVTACLELLATSASA
jgi:ADP-heptose:LPS heptosyltransferase